jgi:ABC-type phosphate transport system auxiliary subunit
VHHHHGNNEQSHDDLIALEQRLLARIKNMIDPVVQALLDQAKKNTSFEKSTHLGFQALSAQVETLRAQISAVTTNGTMTDAEKSDISNTTSDLANSLAALQTDVGANTQPTDPAAGTDPGAVATDPNAAGTDPNAPAADPNATT